MASALSACAGGSAVETTQTTTPATETTVPPGTTTTTMGTTTTTVDPAMEAIAGTWFRWIPIARQDASGAFHGHLMIEFTDQGRMRSGFRRDSQRLQTTNYVSFTFDGEILTTPFSPTLSDEGCDEPGAYRLTWLSDSQDHFQLEVVTDDCVERVGILSELTPADVTYEHTWRLRTDEVIVEMETLNDAISNGAPFRYHPDHTGPQIARWQP